MGRAIFCRVVAARQKIALPIHLLERLPDHQPRERDPGADRACRVPPIQATWPYFDHRLPRNPDPRVARAARSVETAGQDGHPKQDLIATGFDELALDHPPSETQPTPDPLRRREMRPDHGARGNRLHRGRYVAIAAQAQQEEWTPEEDGC